MVTKNYWDKLLFSYVGGINIASVTEACALENSDFITILEDTIIPK